MQRRTLLQVLASLSIPWLGAETSEAAPLKSDSTWNLTDAQWKQRLSAEAYAVLRREGTERPYSSVLAQEKRGGTYCCAGCQLPLFSSKTKYESGTGWPSFWDALPNAIETKLDFKLLLPRTEYPADNAVATKGTGLATDPNPQAFGTATMVSL